MAQTSRIRSRRVRVLTVSDGGHTATIMVGPGRILSPSACRTGRVCLGMIP